MTIEFIVLLVNFIILKLGLEKDTLGITALLNWRDHIDNLVCDLDVELR